MDPSTTPRAKHPLVFSDFFELGQLETSSPFLTPSSRKWGANIYLKAALLAAVLLLISFPMMFFPATVALSSLLLIAVYFLAGIPSLIEAIEDITNWQINIDVLMTLAAFSSVLIGSGMEGGLLLVLFSLSGAMEDAVTNKAKGSLSALHKLSPTKASVIQDDGILIERSLHDIPVNTLILIKSGEVVPLDGVVLKGTSSINMVHLTGENLPVTKKPGDIVPAGAYNQEGALTVQVTHTSADSTLARIIELVTQAQEARPKLQRWFDKLSNRYATTIILIAFIFAVTMPWILSIPFLGYEGSIYRALAFLIAASPCALIIAIPIAYLSALSACAKRGILLKGGIVLDALAGCSTIAFDKTGTLTLGELTCLGIEPLDPNSPSNVKQALQIAYALENNAVHPIAKAITVHAQEQKVFAAPLEQFKSVPGYGLQAVTVSAEGQQDVFIGHPNFIASLLQPNEALALLQKTSLLRESGELLAVLLVGSTLYLFRFADTPRPKILETLRSLKKQNWHLLMLSGDHVSNAKRVAQELGIDEYYGDLRPEDKFNHVSKLAQKGGLVMVGDGINDAPSLSRATVGISMGKVGSATAIEAADVVLLHDNIELLDWLMAKAKKTRAVVKQNLALAAGAILIAVIPALLGFVPLWLAVVLHEGGTVLVGLNALRLLKRK